MHFDSVCIGHSARIVNCKLLFSVNKMSKFAGENSVITSTDQFGWWESGLQLSIMLCRLIERKTHHHYYALLKMSENRLRDCYRANTLIGFVLFCVSAWYNRFAEGHSMGQNQKCWRMWKLLKVTCQSNCEFPFAS